MDRLYYYSCFSLFVKGFGNLDIRLFSVYRFDSHVQLLVFFKKGVIHGGIVLIGEQKLPGLGQTFAEVQRDLPYACGVGGNYYVS